MKLNTQKTKPCLLLAIFILATFFAEAQPLEGDAVLQINPGGHLSQISESVTTADGRYIITTSTDKTICIWDVQQKKLADQIRGPKSVFNQGKLYALAISPDNKLLAVGGFLAIGTETDGDLAGQIRIYDFASRKQVLRFSAHSNVVTALRFSGDGHYLLSGANDSTMACWKMDTVSDKPTVTLVKKIYREDFFCEDLQVLGNTVLATDRKGIVQYKLPYLDKVRATKQFESYTNAMAVNYHANLVAVVNFNQLVILDTLLKEQQVIELDNFSNRVAISPNGQYIITEAAKSSILLFQRKETGFTKVASQVFDGGNTMLGMGFFENRRFYVAGGAANILQFYHIDIKGESINLSTDSILAGSGMAFNEVAVHEKKLALRKLENFDGPYDFTLYPESGRLLKFDPVDTALYRTNIWEKETLSLGLSDSKTELYIYTNNKLTGTVKRDGGSGYGHNAVTITKKNWIISAGSAGFLKLYDTLGRELASFVGHEGDVFSISESADGSFLYSTSIDQTTRMWDLREVNNEIVFKEYNEFDKTWIDFFKEYFPEYDLKKPGQVKKIYEKLTEMGSGENASYLLHTQQIQPRLNIFIAKNKEWVIWNNKGYFKASPNGAAFIGWYVYKGEDENADFYTADKLFDSYYKPEVINELALSDENTTAILQRVKDASSLSIAQQVSNMPVLKLASPVSNEELVQKNINLVFDADNKDFINELILFQNGKRITVAPAMFRGITLPSISIPVELVTGENYFVLSALNQNKAETPPLKFTLRFSGAQATSSLYIFTVGIDKYKNSRYNLNYAKADAMGIAEQLSASSKTIFKNIQIDSLFDERATAENIEAQISQLKKKVKPEDVFLFYYAGHGIMSDPADRSKPDFYLVLHKVTQMQGNDEALKSNGLSAVRLKELLLEIPAQKQLILFDACNSGGAVTAFTRGGGEEAAIFQLARSTGFTVLASTNQEQFAAELKDLKHGIFTYAIINGLKGEADLRKDGKVTVKEIELYLNEIIPLLSEKYKGVQQYPQSFSRGMDFPLTISFN
jgi:WD40 repeat protein